MRLRNILRQGACILAVLLLVGPVLAGSSGVGSEEAAPQVVAVQPQPTSVWASGFLITTRGQPLLIAQLRKEVSGAVPVVLVKLDETGGVRAFFHALVPAAVIGPHGVVTLELTPEFAGKTAATVLLSDSYDSLPMLDLQGGDGHIAPNARSQCDCLCCSNLAAQMCSGGVKSFSCDGERCSFSCK